MSTKKGEVYRCEICENVVKVIEKPQKNFGLLRTGNETARISQFSTQLKKILKIN